jgi:hypothetical protein
MRAEEGANRLTMLDPMTVGNCRNRIVVSVPIDALLGNQTGSEWNIGPAEDFHVSGGFQSCS